MRILSLFKRKPRKNPEIFYVYDQEPEYCFDPKVLFRGTEQQCEAYLKKHGHKISW